MRYLIVIPARGGSKGIPLKNIYKIAGKPLLGYAIESMLKVKYEGDLVVSTDDDKIAEVADQYRGVEVIRRPDDISGDTAKTEAALIHALRYMEEKYKVNYDVVVTLQPTSPLRKSKTIEEFLRVFERDIERFDALLTLSEDRSDFWIQKEEGKFERLFPDAPRRRQERNPLYVENSAIYATSVKSLTETNSVLGHHVNGYVIDAKEAVDINEYSDIALAEAYIRLEKEEQNEKNNH